MKEYITKNEDRSVTVTLDKGMTIDGATVKTITLREPTVADQMAAQTAAGGASGQEVILLANLAQVSPDDIKSLCLRDYGRLQRAYVDFTR